MNRNKIKNGMQSLPKLGEIRIWSYTRGRGSSYDAIGKGRDDDMYE